MRLTRVEWTDEEPARRLDSVLSPLLDYPIQVIESSRFFS